MKGIRILLAILSLTIATRLISVAQDTPRSGAASESGRQSPVMKFYGRMQTLGFAQFLRDIYRDNARLYLYLKQARLGTTASYDDINFDVQFALGGEEEVKAPSPGVALSLLDLSADIPLTRSLRIKVGQFKVPYGRENLTDEAFFQFTDVSVQYSGFKLGRDVGISLRGNSGSVEAVLGVFTGGGRDVPIRYIPLDLGMPMIVARIGVTDGLEPDLYKMRQNLVESTSGYELSINGLYTKDSKVGHSTALNVKLEDKSLLLNSNWNPFIAQQPLDKSELWQVGVDAAARLSGKKKGFSAEGEINYGSFKNRYGSLFLFGGRAQGGYYSNPLEFALRYSFLRPDENFGVKDNSGNVYKIVDHRLIQEITGAISYYPEGNKVKLTAELPVYINEPLAIERNLGAYPLLQQPDQTTVIATGGRAERQTVVEARMQLQVMF